MKTRDFLILSKYTKDDMQAKIGRLEKPLKVGKVNVPPDLNSLTIGELLRLQAIRTEEDMIAVPCEVILGMGIEKVMDSDASEVFGFIVWVSKEMEKINKLFERAKIPPTKEEKQAGVEQLNFGAFGILDWYARRMGIVDHEWVEHVPWIRVYKCLDMDARQSQYERRLREVYANQGKK